MTIAVARTPSSVTVRARCDVCGSLDAREALTAGAAVDLLEDSSWSINIATAAAICPRCS